MLEWIAVGDAYGACFEYADPGAGRSNDLAGYPAHPRHKLVPGCYTDDTQMSIAVAETLLAGDLSREAFADRFVHCFWRDPRLGYSRRMQEFIEGCRDGTDLVNRIRPQSSKSGAAMRASPIGILPDVDEVLRVAGLQARVTHDTTGGATSAQAVAIAAHALRYDRCVRADLPEWVAAHVPGAWDQPWTGRVGSAGVDSARAAIWAVAEHADMASLLRACVGLTGDVDTVAAMALGIAACDRLMLRNVPSILIDGLEDGPYGRRFLERLGARLNDTAEAAGAPAP